MKIVKLTQAQAQGYFQANTKKVVVEFVLPTEEQPLVITGERGKPVSNSQVLKYLKMLKEDQTFTNRTTTDLGYQSFLFENFDSRKGEYRLGFMRNIPDGRSDQVELRVTECETAEEAQIISRFYRSTKITGPRTVRRAVPVAKNTAKNLRMVNLQDSLVVDAGVSRNIALRAL